MEGVGGNIERGECATGCIGLHREKRSALCDGAMNTTTSDISAVSSLTLTLVKQRTQFLAEPVQ